MQTFSDLRRSFFDNQLVALLSLLFAIAISTFLSAHFVVIVFFGISYLAFSHYLKINNILFASFALLGSVYLGVNIGIWIFELPLIFLAYYILSIKIEKTFVLPQTTWKYLHILILFFLILFVQYFFYEVSFHVFLILFLNTLLDFFFIWLLL